jgi:hypothetical protein
VKLLTGATTAAPVSSFTSVGAIEFLPQSYVRC